MAWFGDKKEKKEVVVTDLPLVEPVKTNMPEKTDEVTVSKLPELDTKPAIIEAADLPVTPELPKVPIVDALGLVYFVWMLYKLNVITRIQVKDFLDIIRKSEWPQDVVKYLTDEVKKL